MALNLPDIDELFNGEDKRMLKRELKKEIFVHSVNPGPNDWGGSSSIPMTVLTSGDDCYFILKLPNDFLNLEEAAIVILPDATEMIQWDIEFEAASKGEIENKITVGDLNVQQNVTVDIITELDLMKATAGNPSGLFPPILKANNYISVWFQSNTNNIQIMGLRIKYTSKE